MQQIIRYAYVIVHIRNITSRPARTLREQNECNAEIRAMRTRSNLLLAWYAAVNTPTTDTTIYLTIITSYNYTINIKSFYEEIKENYLY